mgnify:CR=1 FL=1
MFHSKIVLFIFLISIISLGITNENFENFYYLGQSTKCLSCERSLPSKVKYLGGKSKCFSCEKDIARRYGSKYSDLAQPTKCFSCERQMGLLSR